MSTRNFRTTGRNPILYDEADEAENAVQSSFAEANKPVASVRSDNVHTEDAVQSSSTEANKPVASDGSDIEYHIASSKDEDQPDDQPDDPPENQPDQPEQQLRRSKRQRKPPVWTSDYDMACTVSTVITNITVPKDYESAISSPQTNEWLTAM